MLLGFAFFFCFVGLFQRAIMESGVSVSFWALSPTTFTPSPHQLAQTVATILNCPTEENHKLASCLRTQSADNIMKAFRVISNGTVS